MGSTEADGRRCYNLGAHTLSIPLTLHQVNRKRLCDKLLETGGVVVGSVILLQGGSTSHFSRYDTDTCNVPFRQESYFHWAFGVLEPDCYGVVRVDSGEAHIFVPRSTERLHPLDHFKNKYQMESVISKMNPTELLTLNGVNIYNKKKPLLEATFDGIEKFKVNNTILCDAMTECRIFKTETEIEAIRYASAMSTQGLMQIMKRVKPGMYEYQIEGMFKHYTYANGGMRHWPFVYICASGSNGGIPWYGKSSVPRDDELIKDGDLCMFDLGGEYYCYASDVTLTFPVNGVFTPDQRLVYNAVLRASRKVINSIKPGVCWIEMHLLAWRTVLEGLNAGGLLQGDLDDMMKAKLGAVFMPHGVGHLLGVDILDVGGLPYGEGKIKEAVGHVKLRTDRVLQSGLVITVEPGCYFVDYILDKALANPEHNRFIVKETLERFRGFGGVRVEDTVLVTDQGAEILGSCDAPRTVQEIETYMAEQHTDKPIPICVQSS